MVSPLCSTCGDPKDICITRLLGQANRSNSNYDIKDAFKRHGHDLTKLSHVDNTWWYDHNAEATKPTPPQKIMGRPDARGIVRAAKETNYPHRLNSRFDQLTWDELESISKKARITKSEVIREAVSFFIVNKGDKTLNISEDLKESQE